MTSCHVCHNPAITLVAPNARSPRLVSSDARPVEGTVGYGFCEDCGTLQKVIDRRWRDVSDRVYDTYDINHQSEGAEPKVFGSPFGDGPRSQVLLRLFFENAQLGEEGRLLDVGCSNGNLLASFHALRPQWRLSGSEISDRWQSTVLSMPGVDAFFDGREIDYPESYDVVSLSHVLEHIPNPSVFLRRLSRHLTPEGRFLIAVPDLRQNPIDLVIADHCTHFDANAVMNVLYDSGLIVETLRSEGLPKELVAIARVGNATEKPTPRPVRSSPLDLCENYLALLWDVTDAARKASQTSDKFGLMGSSIAAVWLAEELGSSVRFFVDEDRDRIGSQLLGRPICGMDQVPEGATVFIPLSVNVAKKIVERGREYPIRFVYSESNRPDTD